MKWQDVVIAVCQTFIIFAMIPTIVNKDKPALSTSTMNALLIGIISLTLTTLKLWYAAVTAFIIAAMWLILALQKFKLNRQKVLK